MSFFNPFRKSKRQEGVRLAGMTADADPRDAGASPEDGAPDGRREPSLGAPQSAPAAFAAPSAPAAPVAPSMPAAPAAPAFEERAADVPPPAFTFAEPEPVTPPPSVGPVAPVAPAAASASPMTTAAAPAASAAEPSAEAAPWDPYGVRPAAAAPAPVTDAARGVNPFGDPPAVPPAIPPVSSVPIASTASPVSPAAPTAPTAPAASAAPVAPEPAAAASAQAVPPRPRVPDAVRGAAAPGPEAAEAPDIKPLPEGGKARRKPLFSSGRVPTEEEIVARRRTKHRLVGAAAILMGLAVCASLFFRTGFEIDESQFTSERMDVPRESETSTAINTSPVERKPVSGDVDVSNTTLGKTNSTAKANLAREASSKDAPAGKSAAGKPVQTAQAAQSAPARAQKEAKDSKDGRLAAPVKSAGVPPPTGSGWYVQVLATSNEAGAEKAVRRMAMLGLPAYRVREEGDKLWKVRAGLFGTRNEADNARGTIILNGVAQKPYVRKQ